jgi:hypothetical protein
VNLPRPLARRVALANVFFICRPGRIPHPATTACSPDQFISLLNVSYISDIIEEMSNLPWEWIITAALSFIAIFKGKVIYVFLLSLVGVAKPDAQGFLTEQSKIITGTKMLPKPKRSK